ncbi:MAG: oxidoreductase [Thermaerobacter sp.]|nr:oxidoreductase [Thermaerobacter sp.]
MESGGRLIGRSLALRHVDCGSCNACESELAMLFSPDYDAQHSGIDMVASPRHADGLIVTGPGTRQMADALARTLEAVGEPRLVVALGDCAVFGHVHKGGYAAGSGIGAPLAADLEILGCPPAPGEILQALRRLMREGASGERAAATK